jgi:hypothetical protein
MECLQYLYLQETAITKLLSSIERLTGLSFLNLSYCKNLVCLPITFCSSLKSLKYHHLCGSLKFENLPENLRNFEGLEKLHLDATSIRKLPSSFQRLFGLSCLSLVDCEHLVCLPSTKISFYGTHVGTIPLNG